MQRCLWQPATLTHIMTTEHSERSKEFLGFFLEEGKPECPEIKPSWGTNAQLYPQNGPSRESSRGHSGARRAFYALATQMPPEVKGEEVGWCYPVCSVRMPNERQRNINFHLSITDSQSVITHSLVVTDSQPPITDLESVVTGCESLITDSESNPMRFAVTLYT